MPSVLFVIYARCTHLGCTPDWKPAKPSSSVHATAVDMTAKESISKVQLRGRWDRAHVEVSPDGQIVVDIGHLYQQPKGARTQFNDDGAFLRV
jgi:cytochrome b6-f complex iron-sulfur subunit